MALALPVWVALGLLVGGRMHAPAGWAAWASFVLVQPLLEELVFRGILQGQALRLTTRQGVARRLGPVTLANVLVSVAFVALHLRAQPLAWALAVFVPSLVLGHLRERMGSVWPAVLVHAALQRRLRADRLAGAGLTAKKRPWRISEFSTNGGLNRCRLINIIRDHFGPALMK